MINDILNELKTSSEKAKRKRYGVTCPSSAPGAPPAMLDMLRVDYYGQSTPIAQMASVGVPEPRMSPSSRGQECRAIGGKSHSRERSRSSILRSTAT